jgi:ketosteroid isomerase-like protein
VNNFLKNEIGGRMSQITAELVGKAYEALSTGDKSKIQEYWSDEMRWLVPGHSEMAGWKNNLDEFLAFMRRVNELSGNSFRMELVVTATGDDYSADVNHNTGTRAAPESRNLNIDVIHFLRWRDGKIIEGQGAIFGDGTAQYDEFWS